MTKNYNLENVETLRQKSGCSYEEAFSLLDKYDGDITRALIELEKRGQLKNEEKESRFSLNDAADWCRKAWNKGLHTRLIITQKEETLLNLPLLVLLLLLILGPYALIAGALLALITGCSIRILTENQEDVPLVHAEEDAPAGETAEKAAPAEEPEKKDDDFPSITIS